MNKTQQIPPPDGLAPETGSGNLPHLTTSEADGIKKLADHDKEQLRKWRAVLYEAEQQVKYWGAQVDHSSAASLRITMAKW